MRLARGNRRWTGGVAAALSALLAVGGAALADNPSKTPPPDAKAPELRSSSPLQDQILRGGAGEERYYDAASWRALVEGKTLTYRAGFGVMGREYYVPGSNAVVFVYFDGRCYDGSWSENAGIFCFQYDGQHCFQHLTRDGDLIAREMDGDEQVVIEMTDQPLSCRPDLLSRSGAPGEPGPNEAGPMTLAARPADGTEIEEDHRIR